MSRWRIKIYHILYTTVAVSCRLLWYVPSRCSLFHPLAHVRTPHAHSHPRKPAGRQAASMRACWLPFGRIIACSPALFPCRYSCAAAPSLASSLSNALAVAVVLYPSFAAAIVLTWRGPGFASANPVAVVCLRLQHNKKPLPVVHEQRPQYNMNTYETTAACMSRARNLSMLCTTCHHSCGSPPRNRQ